MDGAKLFEMASGFKLARALQAATSRGLFEALAGGPSSVESAKRRLGWHDATFDGVLSVLVPAEILSMDQGELSLPQNLRPYLLQQGQRSIVHAIRWMSYQYERFVPLVPDTPADITPTWISCLHELGELNNYAAVVASSLPLSDSRKVLDMGGGSGVYAAAICQRFENCRVSVFDRPHVAALTRQFLQASPYRDRLEVIQGDFLVDELPQDLDAVFASNIFHGREPETLSKLCVKVHSALRPGGQLVVHGQHVSQDFRHSMDAGLLNLTMGLNGGGRSYSVNEIRELLKSTGFTNISDERTRGQLTSDIVVGTKRERAWSQ